MSDYSAEYDSDRTLPKRCLPKRRKPFRVEQLSDFLGRREWWTVGSYETEARAEQAYRALTSKSYWTVEPPICRVVRA